MITSNELENQNNNNPASFLGFDHLTFWVSNAKQAAEYHCIAFGYEEISYRGLETNPRDEEIVSHVVKQNNVIFVFQSSLQPINQKFGKFLELHGDGIKDIAFQVDDCKKVYNQAISKGAISVKEPTILQDDNGHVIIATINTFGDITHSFVERRNYKGSFLPGFEERKKICSFKDYTPPINLEFIDHMVGVQRVTEMSTIIKWYQEVLNFKRFWSIDDKVIKTDFTSLKSMVLTDHNDHLKFLVCEPTTNGIKKSQNQEFLDFYGGPGIQHIAFHTSDIIHTIEYLQKRGVEFLKVDPNYYTQIKQKLSLSPLKIAEDIDLLEKYQILIDYDNDGYLLQIFTKIVQDRPTLFYEIIQRKHHNGFGAGNILALYKSQENEQRLRGNLTDNN